VTVLPADEIGRAALLAMNCDDHADPVHVADVTSPDHQLVAHIGFHG
jgi:hypothetical protein